MYEPVKFEGKVRGLGFRRGTYEVSVENLSSLQRNAIIETKAFEMGGFKWRIAIFRGNRNSCPIEMIRAIVLSCNDVPVCADVNLTVSRHRKTDNSLPIRKRKVSCPFHYLDRQFVYPDQLTDSDGESSCTDTLVVTADLKNIRIATPDEHRGAGHDMRTIHLEVIDAESINKRLNKGNTFGIVSKDHKRYSDVCSYSLVHLWAQQTPDCRYWLCERSSDGNVVVKGCLNEAKPLESFGNICDESNGVPWVTVFKEEKESNQEFQPIEKDSIIVFCMLDDSLCGDHSYLGHLLVRKRMLCHDFCEKIIEDLVPIQEGQNYSLHLGDGNLTNVTSSLTECGVRSGSVVIVKTQQIAVEQALSSQLQTNLHECNSTTAPGDASKHEDKVAHTADQLQTTNVQEISFSNTKHSDHLTNAGIVGTGALEGLTNKTSECGVPDQSKDVPLRKQVSSGPVYDRLETAFPGPDMHGSVKNSASTSQLIDHPASGDSAEDSTLSELQTHLQTNTDKEMQEDCKNKTSSMQEFASEAKCCQEKRRISNGTSTHGPKELGTSSTDMSNSDTILLKFEVSDEDLSVEAVKEMTAAVKDMQKEFLTDVCNELKRPLVEEIQKVGKAVKGVKTTVTATHEEICKANLMADTTFEQLTENDSYLPLFDRNGKEAFMMADDFVKGEPIFLLDCQKDYRMRIRLIHKHQRDAMNYRIKYVSVKPTDGLELGLKTVETSHQSEGSEVVALFQPDMFQSVRLSQASPQFGAIQEKYVSLPITIGVSASSQTPRHISTLELKGRILCRMATGSDFLKLHSLRRFVSRSWRNLPQWARNGARGAAMLGSMAAGNAVQRSQTMFIPDILSVLSSLFVLPCFRLNGRQVPTEV